MFGSYARKVRDWLGWADTLVMHNASFDMRFLQGEMQRAGLPPITTPHYCTMKAAREMWPLKSVRLDRCLEHCGIERRGTRHGALEDALLTTAIFLQQQGIEFPLPGYLARLPPPRNFQAAAPAARKTCGNCGCAAGVTSAFRSVAGPAPAHGSRHWPRQGCARHRATGSPSQVVTIPPAPSMTGINGAMS